MKKKFILFTNLLLTCLIGFSQNRSDSVQILNYDIHLSIIDFSGQTIDGYTNITAVTRLDSLKHLRLDLQSLTVDSIRINEIISNDYTHNDNIINILLPANTIGDTIRLQVFYNGRPASDDIAGGFYFSGTYAFNIGVAMQSIPHCFGRAWFPCIDEFTSKSTYCFNIRTSNDKKAVCGGLLTDSVLLADSTWIWKWELNSPTPTYLASVAVGHYQTYKDTFQGIAAVIPIEIAVASEHLPAVAQSFQYLKDYLRNFEDKLGAYAWQRVGYVGIPFKSLAMEHACNIAYPLFAIDGSNTYDLLIAHELSHAWFGNLITCDKAEEMWINEGFARYCEALTLEFSFPSLFNNFDAATTFLRNLNRSVLLRTHIRDGGFFALNNVPQEITYGSTSYDKGALVVHALRNYMGDSLFFKSIRRFLKEYAFQNVNSINFINELSQYSGIDLNDFYAAWINQAGFLHFSIDSIVYKGNDNQYAVHISQDLYGAENLGNNNIIDVSFFSNNNEIYTTSFRFSGKYGIANLNIPFQPAFGAIDYYEKLPDATIDYNNLIDKTGKINCDDANVSIDVNSIQDTVYMRVERHLVNPAAIKSPNPKIHKISKTHYWRIAYTNPSHIEGTLYFSYKTSSDSALISGHNRDEIILLYRENTSKDWQIIPSTKRGTALTGSLQTKNIMPGEYCLAIGDDEGVNISDVYNNTDRIFPNPTMDYIDIECDNSTYNLSLYANDGKLILTKNKLSSPTRLDLKKYPTGIYVLTIQKENGKKTSYKLIKE